MLSGCGETSQEPKQSAELQQSLQSVREKYINYTGAEISTDIDIQLSNELNSVGVCHRDRQLILIREDFYWQHHESTPEAIELVLLHEIGHCIYGLPHNQDWDEPNRRPMNVMFPHGIEYVDAFKLNEGMYYRTFEKLKNEER